MDYVPRELAHTIRRAMATFPAVLVTGARQVGKTTLLRREFGATTGYLSLERPDVRARALADPVAFLDEAGIPVILDEIQHAAELLPYIKERIDEDRTPGNWLLTGSQSLALMEGVSESLAGRLAVLTLDPLSVSEALLAPQRESLDDLLGRVFSGRGKRLEEREVDLADWLLRGGFPEPRTNPEVDPLLWFSSYVQTYLERDVRALAAVGDLDSFQRFLFLVGTRTGTPLNLTSLGREVGVTAPTAKRWLSVLKASHTVLLLPPWHRNLGKRIRRSPKLHLCDAGLATWLLGLRDREPLLRNPSFGSLVETAVVTEWVKAFRQRGEPANLFYWQSGSVGEVDLVLDRGGRLYGIEVKATATPTPQHAAGLARWLDLVGPEARGVLACRVKRPVSLRPRIRAVPWHLAW